MGKELYLFSKYKLINYSEISGIFQNYQMDNQQLSRTDNYRKYNTMINKLQFCINIKLISQIVTVCGIATCTNFVPYKKLHTVKEATLTTCCSSIVSHQCNVNKLCQWLLTCITVYQFVMSL